MRGMINSACCLLAKASPQAMPVSQERWRCAAHRPSSIHRTSHGSVSRLGDKRAASGDNAKNATASAATRLP